MHNQSDDGNTRTISDVPLSYPCAEIDELIDVFTPVGTKIQLHSGEILPTFHENKKVCYLLMSGLFSFRHHNNRMIITYAYSPGIAGVGALFSTISSGYFRAETDGSVVRIYQDIFLQYLDRNPYLWKNVTVHLSYIIQHLLIRGARLNVKNAYQIVRNLLMELAEQPSVVRKNITVAQYILDRTLIARSTVMLFLSQLQRGDFIKLRRGRLLFIRQLPEKF